MLFAASLPSFQDLQLDTPILMVGPDDEYAAIFANDNLALLLQSDGGRCVRVGPLRSFGGEDPVQAAVQRLTRQGLRIQEVQGDLAEFLARFMDVAGFTAGHIQASAQLYNR